VPPECHGEQQAYDSCVAALAELQLDYIDLVLLHWPGVKGRAASDPGNAATRAASWRGLTRFYREGRARAIGVSNFTEGHLRALLRDTQQQAGGGGGGGGGGASAASAGAGAGAGAEGGGAGCDGADGADGGGGAGCQEGPAVVPHVNQVEVHPLPNGSL
jgi:diketogulonate reductase-like aldo/keto reductase